MFFDHENKKLSVKIVYYGPAMSGKTTSLKHLFSHFKREHVVESIESTIGRTLYFDFGVLEFKGGQWGLKLLIFTATGQDFYASTRPATLNGVDGIIFVVDSQVEYLERNLRSWNELKNLFGNQFFTIPIVIALNKYDLEHVEKLGEADFISYIDFSKFRHIAIEKTIAINGDGVLKSFILLINFLFPQINLSSRIIKNIN